MEARLKAKELIDKYYHLFSVELENTIADYEAKECALIAVDELINYMFLSENENSFWINYYNKVKQEIEKL